MKNLAFYLCIVLLNGLFHFTAHSQLTTNPIIAADVPDPSIIRVGKTYYMSSTTMHMSPGLPIMKSTDLVNWKIVTYVYDTLANTDQLNLNNGKNDYGRGSWASSLRYHEGRFYVSTFSGTTNKTYIYSTTDIEKGLWKRSAFSPALHDHSLFFEKGRVFMVYGAGKIMLAELNADFSGIKTGTSPKVLIENATQIAGNNPGLPAEGSQLFKVKGKYYLFNITWPRNSMRTVIIHKADKLLGPYTGRIGLQDKGVAQGGLISTPKGEWFSYLFRDYGAVGRIPYLVPVKWEQGWPVLGVNSKVPDSLHLAKNLSPIPGIVDSDNFDGTGEGSGLKKVWQWNHNPDHANWSLSRKKGYLVIQTSRIDTSVLWARNTLTQRTVAPASSAETSIDLENMKVGDCAGMLLLQKKYGWIGVKSLKEGLFVVVTTMSDNQPIESIKIPLKQQKIYLKLSCDFKDRQDLASFAYSLDGKSWNTVGEKLKMSYTIPHFMGYRFGLFNYATQQIGGHADFDYFNIKVN
ncbi:glycoside hydrolase 43 family protein [Pedobacter sp. SG918]|uniref:glycoside hydrolase family 43 protein n=1 Tax=Pedobacter sp. SG918 TaxID=2587136 RepID=UPI001469C802|nr:glycoside hydrolase 43 family protein [Pedobacter sp. SG918]NMN35187.1 beta-xylosidase [Pedobacter sp. SG918]